MREMAEKGYRLKGESGWSGVLFPEKRLFLVGKWGVGGEIRVVWGKCTFGCPKVRVKEGNECCLMVI
jgi:hypothetical protein